MEATQRAPNGVGAKMLRALQNCGDGFVSDDLLVRGTGSNWDSLHKQMTRLRDRGHDIQRVNVLGIGGYRLAPRRVAA